MKDSRVFLGIDVHKKTYAVTAISNNRVIKRTVMEACPQKLVRYCKKYFPNEKIISAYEAGFSGFVLHRVLIENQIENLVVHPAAIEVPSRDRVKTDKRDSLKIATQLEARRLKSIHIPTIEQEGYRAISRLREKLVKDRSRIGAQIKSFINLNGIKRENYERRISRRFIKNLLTLKETSEIVFYLQSMAKRWLSTDEEISCVEEKLLVQAESQKELEKIYRSIPGIGQ